MNPKDRATTYAYADDFRSAVVLSTRKKARKDKCDYGGLHLETIWQVALDCGGRPVSITKKVR